MVRQVWPAWLGYPWHIFPLAFTVPVLAVAIVGLGWVLTQKNRRLLPVWVFLAGYWLLMGLDHARMVRYVLPFSPFVALFAAAALSAIRRTPHLQVIATAVAIVLVLYSFLFSLAYVQAMAHPDPRLEADQWIDRHIPRTEPIFTSETSYYNRPQV